MTIERTHQGAYRVSSIVGGYLVTRLYFGMTKREALREFRAETKGM